MTNKKSKVALCQKCKGFVLASHIAEITNTIDDEFTEFSKEGFDVIIETFEITAERKFVFYSVKKNGKCEECNKN
jgi:hypothetical protein